MLLLSIVPLMALTLAAGGPPCPGIHPLVGGPPGEGSRDSPPAH